MIQFRKTVTKLTSLNDIPGFAGRLPELDGVRGCAILLVLVWHYLQNQIRADTGTSLAYLKQSLGLTWSGVDLFFALSGFLIAGILIDNREKPHYFKAFYARRMGRIFPLYYLNLALFLLFILTGLSQTNLLSPLYASTRDVPLWSYFTFTQNIFMALENSAGPNWLAVTWSLAVEEQFYLLFPLLIRFLPTSRLPLFFLWFIALAVYLKISVPGLSAYINTLWRADSLMAVALLAWLVRLPGFLEHCYRFRHGIAILFISSATGIWLLDINGYLRLGGAFTHLSLAAIYSLFILLALVSRNNLAGRLLRNPVLTWLGMISYGVYLLHTGVSRLVHTLIRNSAPSMSSWSDAGVTLLALGVTLLLAHVSYRWFERRFIRLGHSVSYG